MKVRQVTTMKQEKQEETCPRCGASTERMAKDNDDRMPALDGTYCPMCRWGDVRRVDDGTSGGG